MNKVLHNTPVFRMIGKFDSDKHRFIYQPKVIYADVYKITVGEHSRLICAFKNKSESIQSRWIPMDVLTGIKLNGNFTTKTKALQAITEYFEELLNPEYMYRAVNNIESLLKAEKEVFKALDENQKVCYNKLVDLCEN